MQRSSDLSSMTSNSLYDVAEGEQAGVDGRPLLEPVPRGLRAGRPLTASQVYQGDLTRLGRTQTLLVREHLHDKINLLY